MVPKSTACGTPLTHAAVSLTVMVTSILPSKSLKLVLVIVKSDGTSVCLS